MKHIPIFKKLKQKQNLNHYKEKRYIQKKSEGSANRVRLKDLPGSTCLSYANLLKYIHMYSSCGFLYYYYFILVSML